MANSWTRCADVKVPRAGSLDAGWNPLSVLTRLITVGDSSRYGFPGVASQDDEHEGRA